MSPLRTAVFLAACICSALAAPYELDDVVAPEPFADLDYRLPTNILPVNYKLTLKPYLLDSDPVAKRFTFDGEVEIEIKPTTNTRSITLHSKNLQFSSKKYWTKGVTNVKTDLTLGENNTDTDKVTFTTSTDLMASTSYILHFVYTGTMDDDMHGFYRSSYMDSKNVTKWLGSTQFQTNHARRAFPSFDEPKFKATFDVTIKHHKSMKSVGNTRIISSTYDNDTKYMADVYATTPKMSTYLLAFIVSEFNERFDGDFGVLARPEYYSQTEYSYEVGKDILAALSGYLDIQYYSMGVDKMHMAAIPDFSAGAMENWGLLTYRERSLLYNSESSTLSSKQSIAGVIAHEQAHMWFGDYVTCDWWSYTWLNEGFARYFQYFGTAMVETELALEQQFVVDQIQSVMYMDATNSTNPMSDENTNSPSDLSRMFNSISYNKGASFIRMVNHVMGEENFKKSLNAYLTKYAYQNTKPQNLLDVWKQHWPTTFSAYAEPLFNSFTTQVGYPLITVNVANDTRSFEVSQKRFLIKSDDGANAELLYTVPITYTTSAEKNFVSTTPKLFLAATTAKSTVSLPSTVSWVIANIQETGYYRVNYDDNNWKNIGDALASSNWGSIHELNRAQIVDDLLNLARAGVVEYELALSVLEYLETETNYLPWTSAFNGYSYLAIRLGTNNKDFGTYIRQLTEKSYNMLGFEEKSNDTALDIYNRAKILAWSCKYGNSECVSKAKGYFNNMQTTPVPVNIRSVVYCTSMREGNLDNYNTLFNKYKTETVPTEETLILNNLGCVKEQSLVEKHFWIVVGDDVRRQDKSSALSTLYTENSENVSPVFELVTANFEKLAESMGSYSSVASVISNIASRFTEETQQTKLKDFNTKNKSKFGTSASTLEAAEKTVEENLSWAKLRLGSFTSYLEKRSSGSATVSAFTALTVVLAGLVAILFH